jgi:hypothetical protein
VEYNVLSVGKWLLMFHGNLPSLSSSVHTLKTEAGSISTVTVIISQIWALLGYYTALFSNCLPQLPHDAANIPEERGSHKHRGGSLKSNY